MEKVDVKEDILSQKDSIKMRISALEQNYQKLKCNNYIEIICCLVDLAVLFFVSYKVSMLMAAINTVHLYFAY